MNDLDWDWDWDSPAFWAVNVAWCVVLGISTAFPMPDAMSFSQGLPYQQWDDLLVAWTFSIVARLVSALAFIVGSGSVVVGALRDVSWRLLVPAAAFGVALSIPLMRIATSLLLR